MRRPMTATSETGDPLLLTPGPLTTSAAVKQAMVHDWGSRDAEFLRINKMLADDKAISHVFAVHCETTSGILNPIAEIAAIVARHGRRLLVDSMSAFGALEIDAREIPYDALAASSNKCLEGVPGLGF